MGLDGVALDLPLTYLLLAPVSSVLDALTLLDDRQHLHLLAGLLALYLGARGWVLARRGRGGGRTGGRRWEEEREAEHAEGKVRVTDRRPATLGQVGRELRLFLGAGASLLTFYLVGALAPRPMAGLEVRDPEWVVVDLHTHTEYSHDGRPGLTAEDRRRWGRAAGYDVVYITDHGTLEGALQGAALNPARAGEGTILLPGWEIRHRDQHLIVLGTELPDDEATPGGPWPILLQTIPNNLSRVPTPLEGSWGGVRGIELLDGDPRAIRQTMVERERILSIADSLDLALVAATNHHGWGNTTMGWNLFHIPGWRAMAPEELGHHIEEAIGEGSAAPIRLAERRRLAGGGDDRAWIAATTLPRFLLHILLTLTPGERVGWGLWALFLTLAPRPRLPLPRAVLPTPLPRAVSTGNDPA